MRILLVVGFLISVAICDVTVHKCFTDHILIHAGDAIKCNILIGNITTEFRNDIMARMTKEDDLKCILNVFDRYNITELFLKGLEHHLGSNESNIDAYETDVDESTSALFKSAKVLCTADNTFREGFDEFFNISNKHPRAEETNEDRCVKKYFIDNNIFDPSEYNIDASSINANNCEQIVKGLEDSFNIKDDDEEANTFYGLSAVKAFKCASDKYAEHKVVQNLYLLQILVKLDLNQVQIDNLRDNYVKFMTSSVRFLLECIKEI